MKQNILQRFNLSYSSWSTFKQSEIQGFFQYIKKSEQTNAGIPVYGNAGNSVHKAVEDYVNSKTELSFDDRWNNYRIDYMRGINGAKLSKQSFKDMYSKACGIVDVNKNLGYKLIAEENFKFQFNGMTIKGQIDLVIPNVLGTTLLMDWKTNSKNSYDLHSYQRLFYSWAYWKVNGIIPATEWIYLKDYSEIYQRGKNKGESKGVHIDLFTEGEIVAFECKIIDFIDSIKSRGYDISKYEIGNWKGPFNNYANLCADELNSRLLKENQKITLRIKGHYVFLDSIDPVLEQGIDLATKFDLKDKFYQQKYARENNRGIIDIEDVGVYHLYNKKHKCFPIGILKKVRNIITEYGEYYNKIINVEVIDYRDHDIMNKRDVSNFMYGLNDAKLRDYQLEAVRNFIGKESGIIQMATGAGKTFTAAEIIRRINGTTLWIIDRKELLEQTKEALEKFLGIEVGVIMGKQCDISKPVTIATVQSLNSKLSELKEFMSMFNFVIVDEFHKSAAESYQKVFAKLPNTKYKLGLTATPYRDDGKEPILFSILGDIIFKIGSKELIEQGYLIMPEINFIRLSGESGKHKDYHEEYNDTIVDYEDRHTEIYNICDNNLDKKIMVLTKSVEHGRRLLEKIFYCTDDVTHIHGSTPKKEREHSYERFKKASSGVLIITSSIGAEGLDIPDLDIIINAGANKGDVKSIQILGRALRKSDGKTTAKYYDFVDIGKNTYQHSMARMKVFRSEGYKITVITEK